MPLSRRQRGSAYPTLPEPKAGGRRYLHRFATERTVATDTTAAGGNATLLSLQEDA